MKPDPALFFRIEQHIGTQWRHSIGIHYDARLFKRIFRLRKGPVDLLLSLPRPDGQPLLPFNVGFDPVIIALDGLCRLPFPGLRFIPPVKLLIIPFRKRYSPFVHIKRPPFFRNQFHLVHVVLSSCYTRIRVVLYTHYKQADWYFYGKF